MSGRNFKIGILLKPWTCSHRISVVFLWVFPKLLGLRPPLFSSICFALVEVSKGSGEVKPSDCTVLDMTRSAALLCVISTKHKLDKLNRRQLAQQFIVANERRRNTFGCLT